MYGFGLCCAKKRLDKATTVKGPYSAPLYLRWAQSESEFLQRTVLLHMRLDRHLEEDMLKVYPYNKTLSRGGHTHLSDVVMDAAAEHYVEVRDWCCTKKYHQFGKRLLAKIQQRCVPSNELVTEFANALLPKCDEAKLDPAKYRAAVDKVLSMALPPVVHSYVGEWAKDVQDEAKKTAGAKADAMHSDILNFMTKLTPIPAA